MWSKTEDFLWCLVIKIWGGPQSCNRPTYVEIVEIAIFFFSIGGTSGSVAASRPRQLSAFLYRNVRAVLKRLSRMRKCVVFKFKFIHVYIHLN